MAEAKVEFLLVPEVAMRLRVSVRTVYRLIASRQLASTRFGLGQGGLRVKPEAVTAYIKSREQAAVHTG